MLSLLVGYYNRSEPAGKMGRALFSLELKSYSNKRTFSWHSGFDGHRFLQVMSHFRGFEPQLRRFFFLKSDIKWAFFISSNTLESYVTNLKVRTTSKLKNLYKNEQNSNRDLFV